MVREQRSQKELQKISNDLYYEFYMLDGCAKGLLRGIAHDNRILNNALLEAFGIHARILFHFFYPTKTVQPDDVVADDFFTNKSDWKENKPSVETSFIKEFCDRVSKRIVHLTIARAKVSDDDHNWGIIAKQAYEHLKEAYLVFTRLVPADTLGQELLKEKMTDSK